MTRRIFEVYPKRFARPWRATSSTASAARALAPGLPAAPSDLAEIAAHRRRVRGIGQHAQRFVGDAPAA